MSLITKRPGLMRDNRLSDLVGTIPFISILGLGIVVVLIYWFFSGDLLRFYTSVLFSFYALTNRIWISVMMLGLFQTLIMVPTRIIRVLRQDNIKDFTEAVALIDSHTLQRQHIRREFQLGNKTFVFYIVDFAIQLTTFVTIGRLFLTDFYNKALNPAQLYSFVPYPDYPIQDRWFKLPYPVVTQTHDFGLTVFAVVAAGLVLLIMLLALGRRIYRGLSHEQRAKLQIPRSPIKWISGSLILALIVSWFLTRYFPLGWSLRIFTGDVAVQNTTFNTVTACATFLIMIWFAIPKILRNGRKAIEEGVPRDQVEKTQVKLLRESLTSALLVGAGAFFITNQIPSAFELSVFTLEIVSLASPWTLDKFILKLKPGAAPVAQAEDSQVVVVSDEVRET